jgi:hypothetical protein
MNEVSSYFVQFAPYKMGCTADAIGHINGNRNQSPKRLSNHWPSIHKLNFKVAQEDRIVNQ